MNGDTFMSNADDTAADHRMQGMVPTYAKVLYSRRSSSRLCRIAPMTPDPRLHAYHIPRKGDPLLIPKKPMRSYNPYDAKVLRRICRKAESRKRALEEFEGREPKRRRITGVTAHPEAPEIVPETSAQVITEAGHGVVPQVTEEDHPTAPLEAPLPQPESEHDGNTDTHVHSAPGLFRAAHLAMQQCVRSGVQMATTLRRHFARSDEARETTHADYDDEGDLAISAQLQAELTENITHLSSLSAIIPSFDDQAAAQLQAELTAHAASFPAVVFPPPIISTNAANLPPQDQAMVNQDAMTSEGVLRPAEDLAQEVPEVAIPEAEASAAANEESDAQEIRAAMSNSSEGSSINALFYTREFRRFRPCPLITEPPPPLSLGQRSRVIRGRTHSYFIAPDADVDEAELARQLEAEERGEIYTAAEPEAPTPAGMEDVQDIAPQQEGIDQQPVDETVASQIPTEEAPEPEPQLEAEELDGENAEGEEEGGDDEWRYRIGVPPLMPWMRRRRIRRVALVAPAIPERPVAPAAPARPIAQAVPSVPVFPAPIVLAPATHAARSAPVTPARPQRELETEVEETANQLAATTVAEEGHVSPPVDSDPTGRSISWLRGETPLGRPVSAVRLFNPFSPPISWGNRTAPLRQAEWEAIQEEKRREEEREREEQREQLLQQKKESLGRVRVADGEAAVTPLSDSWEQQLDAVMSGPAQRILVSTLEGAELTAQKLETCYTPMAWLNDEVVNGHLALIVDYLRRAADNLGRNAQPKYYAFNSFFYKKLREGGHESVKRWTRRAKIQGKALLDVETLFIPVHEQAHWTLLVLRPRTRTIEYFDSLYSDPDPFINNAKKWLKGELGELYDEEEWYVLNSPSPQQNNGSDCGVFLLTTAKAIALGLEPTVYGPSDISLIRRKIVAELLNGGLKGDFEPVGDAGKKRL
ncbi:hypothetical protein UA08_07143 [Talaromyces atroroseus]|uniref:Ubiquitin-like protease family profile domain-containing protein n=1 Tax=Talaromyces atroroseus TaxID=1441469 RepID=A0A225ATP4_TALAT|nr:hypothetical protein UA08_07143 [Talaromyces atroroseus]OKL57785.1 hypothetical protein UA08_07143 [Talaromyces atroroseus]